MSFTSVGEFFAMGGHGLYVWLSYGAALIIFAYNALSVRYRERRVSQDLRDRLLREAAQRHRAAPEGPPATGESVQP